MVAAAGVRVVREPAAAFCSGPEGEAGFDFPSFIIGDFRDIVSDHGKLYLRTATVFAAEPESLRVISSEPLDKDFVEKIARDLGRIAVYGTENQHCELDRDRCTGKTTLEALPAIRGRDTA